MILGKSFSAVRTESRVLHCAATTTSGSRSFRASRKILLGHVDLVLPATCSVMTLVIVVVVLKVTISRQCQSLAL